MRSMNFFNYLVLLDALAPGIYSTSIRNEYQNQKNKKIFVGSKVLPAWKIDNLTTNCELPVNEENFFYRNNV
jgi:hypothetical protein